MQSYLLLVVNMASNDQSTDFDSIAELKPTDEGRVHGIVTNVSPMKKGTTPYFEAKVCDEEKQIRLVGFSPNQRKRLANCQDTMNPVALNNVKVKRAKNSKDLEILLKHASQVQTSPHILKLQIWYQTALNLWTSKIEMIMTESLSPLKSLV